jgi:hypothetical protein
MRRSDQRARDSLLTTITTDTGAYAPGNVDFHRFTAPGMCVAAARNLENVLRRSLAAQQRRTQLRQSTPELDTLPAPVAALARTCGARFTIARTATKDLPALLELALLARDDSLARAVVRHQVELAPNLRAKDEVLGAAAWTYLAAEPARVAAADWTVAFADSLVQGGSPNPASSRRTHSPFDASWELLNYARRTFDRRRMRQEAERIIRSATGVSQEALVSRFGGSQWLDAYGTLAELAFVDHPDSLLAVAQRAKDDLSGHPTNTANVRGLGSTAVEVLTHILPKELQVAESTFSSVPAVDAARWFPAQPASWPIRGQVTLLLYAPGCGREVWTCKDLDKLDVHSWLTRYGNQGFSVVVAVTTKEQFLTNGPLTPAAEADSIAWFYRTFRNLPVTVAVVSSKIQQIAPVPDGRRRYMDTTVLMRNIRERFQWTALNAQSYVNGFALLFGRDGAPLYVGRIQSEERVYPLLNALIARAVTVAPVPSPKP